MSDDQLRSRALEARRRAEDELRRATDELDRAGRTGDDPRIAGLLRVVDAKRAVVQALDALLRED